MNARIHLSVLLSVICTCALAALYADPLAPVATDPDVVAGLARAEAWLAAYRADPLPLGDLRVLTAATSALEDRAFYDRSGWTPPLSPMGLGRAVLLNLQGTLAGGSTIDQQVGKAIVGRNESPTLAQKGKELAVATWFARKATRDEVMGLYLNLSCSAEFGDAEPDPVHGLERLTLAMTQQSVESLDPDDQLFLAAVPWGLARMRREGQPAARLRAAHSYLVAEGLWPEDRASALEATLTLGTRDLYQLSENWRELRATAETGSTDYDLAIAVGAFREGLADAVLERFPDTQARMAFAVVDSDGVVARSGAEASMMLINYGSIGKLQVLVDAVEALGVEAVHDFEIEPVSCVRWAWSGRLVGDSGRWCPTDADPPRHPMGLDQAVALSINSMVARHAVLLPYRVWARDGGRPDGLASPPATDSDRAVASNMLDEIGVSMPPAEIPDRLGYTSLEQVFFRELHRHRVEAGLALSGLPEDVTQIVGNSSRDTIENVGRYAHAVLFDDSGTCTLSDAGSLLAAWRSKGTLRWLAGREPDLVFAGKTGSSPQDDAAVAVVALCVDGSPVVLAGGLRAEGGKLPSGLHGAMILRGFRRYLDELRALDRDVESVALSSEALRLLTRPPPPPAEEDGLIATLAPVEALP